MIFWKKITVFSLSYGMWCSVLSHVYIHTHTHIYISTFQRNMLSAVFNWRWQVPHRWLIEHVGCITSLETVYFSVVYAVWVRILTAFERFIWNSGLQCGRNCLSIMLACHCLSPPHTHTITHTHPHTCTFLTTFFIPWPSWNMNFPMLRGIDATGLGVEGVFKNTDIVYMMISRLYCTWFTLLPEPATEIGWRLVHWNTEKCNRTYEYVYFFFFSFLCNLTGRRVEDFVIILKNAVFKKISIRAKPPPHWRKILCAPMLRGTERFSKLLDLTTAAHESKPCHFFWNIFQRYLPTYA